MNMGDIDFLIIGAAKSATTWLQRSLQADPAVFMPDPELHYFSRGLEQGDAWYLKQFEGKKAGQISGEKSNSYLNTAGVAALIHRSMPHVKLIAQLRNPVDRAYSDYCMLYRRGEVSGDISRYLDPRVAADGRFLSGGNYSSQLRDYVSLFGKERILVLTYERVKSHPTEQLNELRAFLGLDTSRPAQAPEVSKVKDKTVPMISPELKRFVNWMKPVVAPFRSTPAFQSLRRRLAREIAYPDLPPDLKARIADYYASERAELERLTERRMPEWNAT